MALRWEKLSDSLLVLMSDNTVVMEIDGTTINLRGTVKMGTDLISPSSTELAALDGLTATSTELNTLAGVTAGTITASKAVVAGASSNILGLNTIASSAAHLALNSGVTASDVAGKTVRVNSITNTGTANSLIGFQSKPAQGASTAQNIIGGEISPRVNDTFALTGSGSLIGLHVDAYLKGTSGDIGGDVRGLNVEMVTDDAGNRAITGNVSMIRLRSAFSAASIGGKFTAMRIEKPETQTGSKTFDAVFELPSTLAGVWNDAPGTEPTTADGYIKCLVNGNARYIQLYSGAPAD